MSQHIYVQKHLIEWAVNRIVSDWLAEDSNHGQMRGMDGLCSDIAAGEFPELRQLQRVLQPASPPELFDVAGDADELIPDHQIYTNPIREAIHDAIMTGSEIKIERMPPLGFPLISRPPRTMSQAEFRQMFEQEAPSAESPLLEALKGLRQSFVVAVGDSSPFARCALKMADEAIIAAEGRLKE